MKKYSITETVKKSLSFYYQDLPALGGLPLLTLPLAFILPYVADQIVLNFPGPNYIFMEKMEIFLTCLKFVILSPLLVKVYEKILNKTTQKFLLKCIYFSLFSIVLVLFQHLVVNLANNLVYDQLVYNGEISFLFSISVFFLIKELIFTKVSFVFPNIIMRSRVEFIVAWVQTHGVTIKLLITLLILKLIFEIPILVFTPSVHLTISMKLGTQMPIDFLVLEKYRVFCKQFFGVFYPLSVACAVAYAYSAVVPKKAQK